MNINRVLTHAAAALLLAAGWAEVQAQEASRVKSMAHFLSFPALKPGQTAPEGWTTWSPRREIAPRFSIDPKGGRQAQGALRIDGNKNPAAVGAWRRTIDGITGGRHYRLVAFYRTRRVIYARRCVSARLDWLGDDGRRVRQPDYALEGSPQSGWTAMELSTAAPENACRVVIELSLAWCPQGTVWWDDIQWLEEPSPRQRTVRAITLFHRPRETKSAAESVEQFALLIESAAARKPDLICLPEGITVIGNGNGYAEASEPIPGPTTKRLGELARKTGAYIVAGIYERVGPIVYNTAVLIGRQGELAGSYRKTHLPREEVEGGITPGDAYPVFATDFGTVGLMICWDVQFPEPARALALQGAEIILLPIWGGNEVLARARAIENHIFLITSSYDMRTFILDPTGQVLAEANADKPIAEAVLHLDQKILQPWLGDMKPRTWKERRPDIPMP